MSYFRNRGLAAVMEEAQVDAPVEPTTEVPAEVEASVGDAVAGSEEQGDFLTAMEEMVQDIDSLERTKDVMEDSVEGDGAGMDETAAKIADVAIEGIVNRMGFRQRKCIVSTEAFGSVNSRKYATNSAVESVMETIQNAWKVFREAVAKYWQKAVDLFKKYFDANTKVRDASKAMGKTIQSIGDKKSNTTAMENSGVFTAFATGGSVTAKSVETILDNHKVVIDQTSAFVKLGVDIINEAKQHVTAIKEAKEGDETTAAKGAAAAWITEFLESAHAKVSRGFQGFKRTSEDAGKNEGMDSVGSGQLVNNQRLIVAFALSTSDSASSVFKCMVVPFDSKATTSGNVPVLGSSEMTAIASKVNTLAEATEALKKMQGEVGNFEKSVTGIIDEVIKKSGAGENFSKETNDGLAKLKRAISDLNNALGSFTNQAPKMAVVAGQQALRYIEASLKTYGEAK